MKASELRIGNLCKEITHSKNDITEVQQRHYEDIEKGEIDLFPIPLTEEWLVKFGFKKREGNNICWDLGDFMIGWYGNKYASWVIGLKQENNELYFHSKIKYVHSLQNLFFSVCEEELVLVK